MHVNHHTCARGATRTATAPRHSILHTNRTSHSHPHSLHHTHTTRTHKNAAFTCRVTAQDTDTRITITETSPRSSQTYSIAASSITSTTTEISATSPHRNPLFALFLPDGYPDTVADDYLAYQLWSIPAHITGWLSISLTTSSLLNAVGISASPAGATASAAAIKWITKDGIGAAGKVVVGVTRRLGLDFDDDPRRWRMIAEGITTVGLGLEITTSVYPQQFLLLASLGNFLKALGKGITLPVFRVIQTHQAVSGNVGVVAAKEELWEVVGKLGGYASSLAVLQLLETAGWRDWQSVVGVWVGVQAVHVWLRYIALSSLCFENISQKRGCMLATAHVAGQPLLGVKEINRLEPMLLEPQAIKPSMEFGCSLKAAVGDNPLAAELMTLVKLYENDSYILTWRQGQAMVVLKEGYRKEELAQGLMQAMWQAAWLEQHPDAGARCSMEVLQQSLRQAQEMLPAFLSEAAAAGWHVDDVVCNTAGFRVQVQGTVEQQEVAVPQ